MRGCSLFCVVEFRMDSQRFVGDCRDEGFAIALDVMVQGLGCVEDASEGGDGLRLGFDTRKVSRKR